MARLLVLALGVCALALGLAPGAAAPPRRKVVLVVGIDGCRLDAVRYSQAKHLKALLAEGAVSDNTDVLGPRKTKADTASGPCWGSILTGVWADKHGVIDNSFRWANFRAYPSFLFRLQQARPGARTAALITWKPLADHLFTAREGCRLLADGDKTGYELGDRLVGEAGAKLLRDTDLDAAFVYFGNVDSAGHGYGFHPRSPKYTNSIETVDGYLGRLLTAVRALASYHREDWLIIVCTDHGGKGRGHGGGATVPEIRTGFLILHGPSVRPGKVEGQTYNVDVVATALAHLGVARDPRWGLDGRVLSAAVTPTAGPLSPSPPE